MPLAARPWAFVRRLPDHSLLDQIVRGRAWIPLLGVLLAGIVAMQVEVLKLSATMGRSLERGTALQSRNEQLRASVAQLSDDQRIERLAAGMGMVMPTPTQIGFLAPRAGGQIARAVANIQAPDATSFIAALPPSGAATAATTGSAVGSSSPGATASVPTAPTPSVPTSPATTAAPVTTGPPATSAAPTSVATAAPASTPGASPTSSAGATYPATVVPSSTGGAATGAGG